MNVHIHRPRRAMAAGAVAAVSALLVGCAGGSSSSAGAGSLSFAYAAAPSTLNPWAGGISMIKEALYDSLTRFSSSGKPTGDLATSWQYTTPKTLVLHLRTGVKFSDGTAFDSAVVKANLEYGAKSSTNGAAAVLSDIASIATPDAATAVLTLKQADPDLPALFADDDGWMVAPSALAKPATLNFGSDGTGPYTLDTAASTSGHLYTFTIKHGYWDLSAYPYSTVTVSIVGDPTTQINEVRSGQLDITSFTAGSSVDRLPVTLGPATGFTGLALMDLSGKISKPLADVRVREALNYAVDRAAILKDLYGGSGVISNSVPMMAGSAGWNAAADYYSYDPAKAKALLAAAGYPHGFTLKVLNTPAADTVMEAIAGYLQAVGVTLDIQDHTSDLIQQAESGTWPAGIFFSSLTGSTYTDITDSMTPASYFNFLHANNLEIDSLLAQIANSTSAATAQGLYGQLATYAARQAWFVVPVLTHLLWLHSSAVNTSGLANLPVFELYAVTPAS